MRRLHQKAAIASCGVALGLFVAVAALPVSGGAAGSGDGAGFSDSNALARGGPPPGRGPRWSRGAGGFRGQGRGYGRGQGRGPDQQLRADQAVFHYLLAHHKEIRRTVTHLEDGVETLTESDNPEVAAKIREHVAAMHERVKQGNGLRYWDDLFAALFDRHASIQMEVEETEKGVKVVETSDDPAAVPLIQAHAGVVSLFVKHGFAEARRDHAAPDVKD